MPSGLIQPVLHVAEVAPDRRSPNRKTKCSIRQKAGVETRIEHANARLSRSSGDHNARSTSCSRPRLHDDLDVAPEQDEKPNKSIEREPSKPTSSKSRNLRLVDFEQRGAGSLRQSAPLDDRPNLPRQFGLGQRFRGLGCPKSAKTLPLPTTYPFFATSSLLPFAEDLGPLETPPDQGTSG